MSRRSLYPSYASVRSRNSMASPRFRFSPRSRVVPSWLDCVFDAGSISVRRPTLNLCFLMAARIPGSSFRRRRKARLRSALVNPGSGSTRWKVYSPSDGSRRRDVALDVLAADLRWAAWRLASRVRAASEDWWRFWMSSTVGTWSVTLVLCRWVMDWSPCSEARSILPLAMNLALSQSYSLSLESPLRWSSQAIRRSFRMAPSGSWNVSSCLPPLETVMETVGGMLASLGKAGDWSSAMLSRVLSPPGEGFLIVWSFVV
ncbi:hypothetical protein VM1G_09567 [Cytospora mali]|uniref:Uncharacterized protein n=1 Tax=Cytospora mali TaxID=578113 RepID=A0A194WCP5_CYTMA|nr:hypothetical protein VM1G_09567 [Valsa mali]